MKNPINKGGTRTTEYILLAQDPDEIQPLLDRVGQE
jgi:hypothetical protein